MRGMVVEDIKAYICERVKDSRQEKKVVHKLVDIVIGVLCAVLANADDWVEIAICIKMNLEIMRKYVPFANGAPSHDTIQRVMGLIKPEVFEGMKGLFMQLVNSEEGEKLKKILAIDGKTMRGNGNKNQDALHVVSAYSREDGICFGQKSSDTKGKEIPMIKELLGIVNVKGQIVTIDAIGTQVEIAGKIKHGKGDNVLAVKENQGNLYKDIEGYFSSEEVIEKGLESGEIVYKETIEKAHGQIETRKYYQSKGIKWLKKNENERQRGKDERKGEKWAGLTTIGMVKTIIEKEVEVEEAGKKVKRWIKKEGDTRYYISSLPLGMEDFARAVRGHWSVEIMHWHLDVTFREDHNQTLDKNAAENLNIIRKWALSILKYIDLGTKYSLKKKRFAISCGLAKYIDNIMSL
jgi:predicted transposase YbfD/YdcC